MSSTRRALRDRWWSLRVTLAWYFRNPLYRWSTIAGRASSYFCTDILVDQSEITEDVLIVLKDRLSEIQSPFFKIDTVSIIILALLLLSVFGIRLKMDIQGVRIDLTDEIRDILYFLSAALFSFSMLAQIPASILQACIKLCLEFSKIPEWKKIKYSDRTRIFSYLTNFGSRYVSGGLVIHALIGAIILSLIIFVLINLVAFSFIYVGLQIYLRPAPPTFWAYSILVYAGISVGGASLLTLGANALPCRHLVCRLSRQAEIARRKGRVHEDRFNARLSSKKRRYRLLFKMLATRSLEAAAAQLSTTQI